jgi:hypothetical protein
VGDGDRVPFTGYQRWTDLQRTREYPLVDQPELVRPYVWWRWPWSR